ncbi:MAG: hypothetical protein AAGA54_19500 [Myxococcota bacterium]
MPSETNSLCPVSDDDPSIPASARECTEADEGSNCRGTVLGCGSTLLEGRLACVAGTRRCVHDPDVVERCGEPEGDG